MLPRRRHAARRYSYVTAADNARGGDIRRRNDRNARGRNSDGLGRHANAALDMRHGHALAEANGHMAYGYGRLSAVAADTRADALTTPSK